MKEDAGSQREVRAEIDETLRPNPNPTPTPTPHPHPHPRPNQVRAEIDETLRRLNAPGSPHAATAFVSHSSKSAFDATALIGRDDPDTFTRDLALMATSCHLTLTHTPTLTLTLTLSLSPSLTLTLTLPLPLTLTLARRRATYSSWASRSSPASARPSSPPTPPYLAISHHISLYLPEQARPSSPPTASTRTSRPTRASTPQTWLALALTLPLTLTLTLTLTLPLPLPLPLALTPTRLPPRARAPARLGEARGAASSPTPSCPTRRSIARAVPPTRPA